jgi:predicted nucleic acid-binding protein
MVILDTTVLVYAVGADHPLREGCVRVLAAHRDGSLRATTTVEVIQEFAHVYARRRTREEAVRLAGHYVDALDPLAADAADVRAGLELFRRVPALGAFDTVLAAVALRVGADALISADGAFGSVPGLRWVDPASDDLAAFI